MFNNHYLLYTECSKTSIKYTVDIITPKLTHNLGLSTGTYSNEFDLKRCREELGNYNRYYTYEDKILNFMKNSVDLPTAAKFPGQLQYQAVMTSRSILAGVQRVHRVRHRQAI